MAVWVIWILVQPLLWPLPPTASPLWLRLAVAGGLVGVGTVLAVILALIRVPTRLTAALLLDEKFGLRERVTTSLTLTPQQRAAHGPGIVGQRQQRIAQIHVRTRIGFALPWTVSLVPASVILVVLAAWWYPNSMHAEDTKPKPIPLPSAEAARMNRE